MSDHFDDDGIPFADVAGAHRFNFGVEHEQSGLLGDHHDQPGDMFEFLNFGHQNVNFTRKTDDNRRLRRGDLEGLRYVIFLSGLV